MSARPLVNRLADALEVLAPEHPLLKEVPCRYCNGVGEGWAFSYQSGTEWIRCSYCAGTGFGPNRNTGEPLGEPKE